MADTIPISDAYMHYDVTSHRYELTADGVYNELGINLPSTMITVGDNNNTTMVQRFLKKVSSTVYRYIYQDNPNETLIEYLLAMHEPLRPKIFEMLLAQAEYNLTNGFVQDFSGVNVAKGTAQKLQDLRGAAKVCDTVVQMCEQEDIDRDYRFPLKTLCFLSPLPPSLYREGY